MTSVTLTVELPKSLVEEARAAGILSDERLAALLEMELRRAAAWERFNAAAAMVREAAASGYGELSEDEVMQLVDEEIHLMRAEDRAREVLKRSDNS
jgi:roadblock/LC7 domain-containing protein